MYIATSFNLWICKGAHDIFALLINFLGSYWQPKQMTIGLFEIIETIGQNLATNLTKLLDQYGLRKKTIAYVKDEGSNLTIMTITFKWIVKREILGLDESFQGIYFGHSFFKAC